MLKKLIVIVIIISSSIVIVTVLLDKSFSSEILVSGERGSQDDFFPKRGEYQNNKGDKKLTFYQFSFFQ